MPPESSNDLLLLDRPVEGVLIATLNRPEKLNALSKALLGDLTAALAAAKEDDTIRAVVLTGRGKAFSAGADISDMVERGVESYLDPERLAHWQAIEAFPKPLIAAVNGYALGGGCELAMLCDLILASEEARFGLPEINIGVLPGDGGTQRLPRLVGKAWATRLILTGEIITAAQARDIGLVIETTEPDRLLKRATALAAEIASKAPLAAQLAKQAMRGAFEKPLSEGLLVEREAVKEAFKTEDRAEGMRAFLEKRPPVFRGR